MIGLDFFYLSPLKQISCTKIQGPKKFGSKDFKNLCVDKFVVQKILGRNNVWSKKYWVEKILFPKNFQSEKLCPKNLWVQKNVSSQKFRG